MTSRSRVHMLSVAATRLEQDHANPKLVADLRAAAKEEADRILEGRAYGPEEEKRIARQRTKFNMVPDTHALGNLKEAMLQRAYDLMWDGRGTECDAVAEFLPSADVERMFNAWEADSVNDGPKSRFYQTAEERK